MHKLSTRTAVVAAVAGGAWTLKALVIAAADASVQPVEGVLYLGGLLGIAVAAALAGADLAGRWWGAVAGLVAGLALTVALEAAGHAAGGALGSSNLGVDAEAGILLAGLAWLAAGLTRLRAGATPAAVPAR